MNHKAPRPKSHQKWLEVPLNEVIPAVVAAKCDEIRALLIFLVDLDMDERRSLPKIGAESRAFVESCLKIRGSQNSFLLRRLDGTLFATDASLWRALEQLRIRLTRLAGLVKDTELLAGSEGYLAKLEVCAAVKGSGDGVVLEELVNGSEGRFVPHRCGR